MKKEKRLTDEEKERLRTQLHRDAAERRRGYRERALALFPHVCGSCGRSFSGRRLKELTVHHKDHDYRNNPPDGSNWELLCIYCHDHEHEKYLMAGREAPPAEDRTTSPFQPFPALDAWLDKREENVRRED